MAPPPFHKLSMEGRIAIEKDVIKATKKRSMMGFAVSIDEADYNRKVKGLSGLPSAYSFCLMQCFFVVRRWVERTNYKGDIAYFFESGHPHQGEADQFVRNEVVSSPEKKALYRYAAHAFVEKRIATPLSSGDLLAWQWYHYHARRPRPPRKDLKALLRSKDMVLDFSDADIDEIKEFLTSREEELKASEGQSS